MRSLVAERPFAGGAVGRRAADFFGAAVRFGGGVARRSGGAGPVAAAFGFDAVRAVLPAAVPDPARVPAEDDVRFSLRCPGRERGRLPSTPGSSLLSAATREK